MKQYKRIPHMISTTSWELVNWKMVYMLDGPELTT